MPRASYALFLSGVFAMFLTTGLLSDIARQGADTPARLLTEMLFTACLAVAYNVIVFRPRWLVVLIAVHVLLALQFDRLVGGLGAPLAGEALRARLALDVNGAITAIIVGFVLLSNVITREGARYGRAHAEIAD